MITLETSAGSADDEVLYISQKVEVFNEHYIETLAGAVTVQVSLDGENWTDDMTLTSMGGLEKLEGAFKKIRVLQDGATNSQARVAHVQTAES